MSVHNNTPLPREGIFAGLFSGSNHTEDAIEAKVVKVAITFFCALLCAALIPGPGILFSAIILAIGFWSVGCCEEGMPLHEFMPNNANWLSPGPIPDNSGGPNYHTTNVIVNRPPPPYQSYGTQTTNLQYGGGIPPTQTNHRVGGGNPPQQQPLYGGGNPPPQSNHRIGGENPPPQQQPLFGGGNPPPQSNHRVGGGNPPQQQQLYGGGNPPPQGNHRVGGNNPSQNTGGNYQVGGGNRGWRLW